MRKIYITPNIKVTIPVMSAIMAASAEFVSPGDGEKYPVEPDEGDDGWAAAKDNSNLWGDSED